MKQNYIQFRHFLIKLVSFTSFILYIVSSWKKKKNSILIFCISKDSFLYEKWEVKKILILKMLFICFWISFLNQKMRKNRHHFCMFFFKLLLKNTYSYVYKKRKKKKLNDKCLVHDVSVNPYTKIKNVFVYKCWVFYRTTLKIYVGYVGEWK